MNRDSRPATPSELLDACPEGEARAALLRCCASQAWVEGMLARRPFGSDARLLSAADVVWAGLGRSDYLEAFSAHPRIGADIEQLRERFASTATWSSHEQSSVAGANADVLEHLRDGNVAYEQRFGYLFIVCATGKSAEEMLELLQARLHNDSDAEITVAAGEQAKITKLRLEKLTP